MKANTLRTLSVSGAVAALAIAATPAWAHHERYYGHAPRYVYVYQYRPAVVAPPVVSYRYAPAPVYYVAPPAYVRAPVPYRVAPVAYVPLGAIGGAMAGAAIGSVVSPRDGRTAAIAIGSVVGAMIGGQLAAGR